ncbi:PHP domain-containing protein [Paenibacillus endoradicis]|uniref:PHP domain-containing protein n=1 Tax=Paenibacillus endoradicis TaxID=2972487 RepID=UPI002158B6ED|nr:PHP domain-containing protein [Paenibacillus endoradicis]MCR8659906.1 PHP domain-containing protein [Paenibacillus endoradicis]
MKIDLHTHAKWSKDINFSYEYYVEMMREASKHVDAVALTEHFNTKDFLNIYEVLDDKAVYHHGYYLVEGVKIFPGIEVDVAEQSHILVIGSREAIISISKQLDNYRSANDFIPLGKLIEISGYYQCLTIGAHPYRKENPLDHVDPALIARLDAIDINGRDLHKYGLSMEQRVQQFADSLKLPVIVGSDTHQPLQFGCVYNELPYHCDSVEQIRALILQGKHQLTIADDLHEKVQNAEVEQKKYKEAWKVR